MARKKKLKEPVGIFEQKQKPKFARQDIQATQQIISQEQRILNSMFGGGVGRRVLGDTRPRINKTLQGGDDPRGLIQNGDGGYTSSLFLPRGRRAGRIR